MWIAGGEPCSDIDVVRRRLERAERQLRMLSAFAVLSVATLLVAAVRPQEDVLRARGLVITDAEGRERIVLGAPMGQVSANAQLGASVGVAVLDASGRLNVAVGAHNPLVLRGGRIGQRMGESAGLTIYDPRGGYERGGMSVYDDGRANVCLDYDAQREAACMTVAPGDQYAAVLLNSTPNLGQVDQVAMFVGADGIGVLKAFGTDDNGGGVVVRAGRGPASITVYDSTGTAVGDVAQQLPR